MNANQTNDTLSEREEIEALLPWYVTGKLDPHLRARVERYLADHPDVAKGVVLAREESGATIAANEAIRPSPHDALDRLRASVAAAPRRKPLSTMPRRMLESVSDWFAGFAPPQLALAGGLAALLVVVQAAAIGTLVLNRPSAPAYETATGAEQPTQGGYELLIGFSKTATIEEITALLKTLDASVIDGPRGGLYRVRIPESGAEVGGRDKVLSSMRKSRIVTLVLPGR